MSQHPAEVSQHLAAANEIILVQATVVVRSSCSRRIMKLNDAYSGAELLVPVLAVSTETWLIETRGGLCWMNPSLQGGGGECY